MEANHIMVYGTRWCGDTKRALRILAEMEIPFTWVDIDQDKTGEEFVKQHNHGNRSVPTIIFADGSSLVEPSNDALRSKLQAISGTA